MCDKRHPKEVFLPYMPGEKTKASFAFPGIFGTGAGAMEYVKAQKFFFTGDSKNTMEQRAALKVAAKVDRGLDLWRQKRQDRKVGNKDYIHHGNIGDTVVMKFDGVDSYTQISAKNLSAGDVFKFGGYMMFSLRSVATSNTEVRYVALPCTYTRNNPYVLAHSHQVSMNEIMFRRGSQWEVHARCTKRSGNQITFAGDAKCLQELKPFVDIRDVMKKDEVLFVIKENIHARDENLLPIED